MAKPLAAHSQIHNMAFTLNARPGTQAGQVSFIGGKPKLPIGWNLPVCKLCGSTQTFFFQVAMPRNEIWENYSIAVFNCTKCADEHHLIPQMLNISLRDVAIPEGFLTEYQSNFAFIIFPTDQGEIFVEYEDVIMFSEIQFDKGSSLGSFGKLGGRPDWILDDESPATYGANIEMAFLLELAPAYQFKMNPKSTPQVELDIMGRPTLSPLDHYLLFLGNALYLFGTCSGERSVYAITQV